MKKLDIEDIKKDPTCQQWISYCLSEPSNDNPRMYSEWIKEKQKFWETHSNHLTPMGFSYEAGLSKALDFIDVTRHQKEDLEGCLLVVKIGSDARPATAQDIEGTYKILKDALEGIKGVRVVITHHNFSIEKVALPQLRRIQSEILTSFEDKETNSNPIISDLEV